MWVTWVGAAPADDVAGLEEAGATVVLCFELDMAGLDCDGLCEGVIEELGVCGVAGACGDVGLCVESGASEATGVLTGEDVSAGEGVSSGVGVSAGPTVSGALVGSGLGGIRRNRGACWIFTSKEGINEVWSTANLG